MIKQIPLDIPSDQTKTYNKNFDLITKETGRLFLFAGDQKVEHMNKDYFGEGISKDDANPEHLFQVASKGRIGAFASQIGLIARYGGDYRNVPYIIKLNAKTDLVKTTQKDPFSRTWTSINAVQRFKESSGLNVVGVGYTIYPGSEYEGEMFAEAAKLVFEAHQLGLLAVVWAYARGKAVLNEKDPHTSAGCAGIGAALGADFVKVNPPKSDTMSQGEALVESVLAAGRTGVICAGGSSQGTREFLQTLHDQVHIAGCRGNATGRNVHQRELAEAVRLCEAISAITYDNKSVDEAFALTQVS